MFIRCTLVQDVVQGLDVLIEVYDKGEDSSHIQVFTCDDREGGLVWNHEQMTHRPHLSGVVDVLTGNGYCPCERIRDLDGERVLVKARLGDTSTEPFERELIVPKKKLVRGLPIMVHTKDELTEILTNLVNEATSDEGAQDDLVKEAMEKIWCTLPLGVYESEAAT